MSRAKYHTATAFSLLLTVLSNTAAGLDLNLTVFYESRCPDSERYFESQLKPTIDKYPNINLELVPYGKATSSKVGDDFQFQCQHGQVECEGNMFHACAINQSRDDVQLQVSVTACMIDHYDSGSPKERAEKCCKSHGMDCDGLLQCATSKEGARLLYNHGIRTSQWHPTFIPLILLNDEDGNQNELLLDLETSIANTLGKYNSLNVQEMNKEALSSLQSAQEKLRSSLIMLTTGFVAIPNVYV